MIGFLQSGKAVLVPCFLTYLITSSTSPGFHWLRPLPDVYKLFPPPPPFTYCVPNLGGEKKKSCLCMDTGVPVKYVHQLGGVSVPDWGEILKSRICCEFSRVSESILSLRSGTYPSSWAGGRFHPVHVAICQITWRWAAIRAYILC